MNIKATLLRFCDLSWKSLVELKAWAKNSRSFKCFDVSNVNNPLLKVASATNSAGETVVFCPVETCYLVSAYAINPSATPDEAMAGGNAIDAELARQAQRAGVSKLLIILPKDTPDLEGEWRELKVFERNIPATIGSGGIGTYKTSQATQYIN